ncbi:Bud-site selection protein [Stemphylium lycopersici]|nr:ubiquitin-protein ligase e3a protein [Stemphylium lycopersici]RAR05467.1 Bud-site selection protein [Stemphylium lycopersici]
MPKRKRSSPPPEKVPKFAPIPAKRAKSCEKRLAEAQKPLLQALRHGSVLERQKHSRRKKDATKKKDTTSIDRLNAEYQTLKALNLEQLGDQHLRKTLARVKSLKDAEPLQEYIAGIREGSKDTNTLNVTARLFKVVQVKKVVDGVIEDLKNILGVAKRKHETDHEAKEPKAEVAKKSKKKETADKEDVDMKDASDEADDPYMAFSARIAAPSSGEDDSEASVTDDERPPSIGDSESEHDPEDDLDAESESESLDEHEDVDEEEAGSVTGTHSRSIAPPSDEDSEASGSGADSDTSGSAVIPTKKTKTKATDEKPTSSAFLPALSHAAYFSGSESEASDLDADTAPRKNRRGQRARQKLAELKYGQKAKHIEKQQRSTTFDPKRGAVAGDDKRQRRGKPMGRGPQQTGTNAEPLGDRNDKKDRKMGLGAKRDDKGELHPSWQAAKLAKESKKFKIDLGGGQAAGKKVVFD